MIREDVIRALANILDDQLVVCNIGHPSQELYAIKDAPTHFYMLGSMGLSSSIGLGLGMCLDRPVVAIDGDGSILMNLGTFATIAHQSPHNLTLIVVDNGAYGSTGDQPTFTGDRHTSLSGIARAAGIEQVWNLEGKEVGSRLPAILRLEGTKVAVVRCEPGRREIRPISIDQMTIKNRFREAVQKI